MTSTTLTRISTKATPETPPAATIFFAGGDAPDNPRPRRTRTYWPAHDDLDGINLHVVATRARTLWPDLGLIVGDKDAIFDLLDRLVTWATEHGHTDLNDLTGDAAAAMFLTLSGAADLSEFDRDLRELDDHVLARLQVAHDCRNLLLALRATGLLRVNLRRTRTNRPAGDSLALPIPDLPSLTGGERCGRPLTDTEILLARAWLEVELFEKGDYQTIVGYLLAEMGIRHTESTKLTSADLDNPLAPTSVTVPGRRRGERTDPERVLEFEEYTQQRMVRANQLRLNRLRKNAGRNATATKLLRTWTLTYTGAKPGDKAAVASLTPKLDRFLHRAGINHEDVTALSICRALPNRLVRSGQFMAAKHAYGATTRELLNHLGWTSNPGKATDRLHTLIYTSTKELVARVPNSEFYDAI